jgi:hypothetical protein
MAIKGESFEIPIEGRDDLSPSFKSLEKAITKLTKEIKKAQKAMETSMASFSKNADVIKEVENSYDSMSATQKEAIKQNENLFASITDLNSSLNILDSSISLSIAAFSSLSIISGRGLSKSLKDVSLIFNFLIRDIEKISKSFTQKLIPGFLNLVKGSALASPVLILLGKNLRDSEIEIVRLIGTLQIIAGLLLGAFSLAVIGAINIISDLAIAVGDSLIKAFSAFEEESAKFNRTMSQFVFTIEGFNKTVGTEAVGSLETWQDALSEVESSTTFTSDAIAKSIQLIVAEGSRLGLTVAENNQLLKTASDLAASTGKDLIDVTTALLSGVAGQGQAVLALGLDIRETALSHSKLIEASGTSFKQMSDGQKTILRLQEIFEQSRPVLGAAAADLETVAGANELLEKRMRDVRVELGKQTSFTVLYTRSLINLTETLLSLPDPILQVVGTLGDFLGVSLKIIGTIGKYLLVVTGLTTGYKLLNSIISSSIVVQTLLTRAFNFSSLAIGRQSVAVRSLGDIWKNFNIIIKGSLSLVGSGLVTAVKAATIALGKFLIVFTPIAIKIALVIAVVKSLIDAVKEIVPELEIFSIATELLGGIFDQVRQKASDFFSFFSGSGAQVLARFTLTIKNLAKILVSSLSAALTGATIAWLKFKQSVLDNDKEAIETQKTIAALGRDLDKLAGIATKSIVEIGDAISGKSFAAIEAETEKVKKGIADISTRFKQMGKDAKKSAKEAAEALRTIQAENRNLQLAIDNQSASESEKTKNNLAFAIQNLELKRQELKANGLLTEEINKQLSVQEKLLRTQASGEIAKIEQAALAARGQAIDALGSKNRSFEIERLNNLGQYMAAQELQNQAALNAFDKEIAKMRENHDLRKEDLNLIEETRKALIERNKAALAESAEREQNKTQEAIGDQGPQLFGPEQVKLIQKAFGDVAGQMAGAASSMMSAVTGMMAAAQAIVGAIQQLIDFGPQFLDAVANIFNSLAELPFKMADASKGLFDAVGNFIKNFLPNLVKGFTQQLSHVVEFIAETLPDAFVQMPELLFDAFLKLFDKIPELLEKLVAGLIRLLLTTPVKMIDALIRLTPKLVGEWLRMGDDIALALLDGLALGLKELANSIANLLGFDDIFDIPEIDEKIKGLGDDISRASSQIFKVLDLEQAGRGLDVADRIRTAILSSTNRGANVFSKAWQRLKNWFTNKFGPIISDAWKGFVNNVKTAAEGFGRNVSDQAKGFGDNVSRAWKGFVDNVGVAAEGFARNVRDQAKGFGDNVSRAWKGFVENVTLAAKGFGENVSIAWKELVKNVTEAAKSFGKGLSDAGKSLIEFFFSLGETIWEGLKSVLKLPEIPTPQWVTTFADAVKKLTGFNIKLSKGGLVGKVQNTAANSVAKSVSTVKDAGGSVSSGFKRVVGFETGGFVTPNNVKVPTGKVLQGTLYAQGGSFAPNQGTDTIDAKLTPGEFVVNREATRNNLGLLSFINQAKEPVTSTAGSNNFSIVINAKTDLSADQIRREVVPELEKHLRRRSQEGRSMINAAGIRT